jgi:hypothetical protein
VALSDFHCSVGDARSITDPVTNWVMISGVDLKRDLANMIRGGKYPLSCLPIFLHEAVHHMCFDSPVGMALSMLQLRARRKALLHITNSQSSAVDKYDVAEDAIRYESAIHIMRPLAEGLALFGEFDAFPGDSPVMSNVMKIMAINFREPREERETIADTARRILWGTRVGSLFTERKADLLVQPLVTTSGGYLAGYLTVKNLQLILMKKMQSGRFLDSDLFLFYLLTYFYHDFGFVATLLDPDHELDPCTMGESDSS